jgi:hypothetical protein
VEKLNRVVAEMLREKGEEGSVYAQVVAVEPKWGAFLGDEGVNLGRGDIQATLSLFRNGGEKVQGCAIGDLEMPEMLAVEAERVTF